MVFTPEDDYESHLLVTESAQAIAQQRLYRLLAQEGWETSVVRDMPQPFVSSAQGQCQLHFCNGVRIQVTAHQGNAYSVYVLGQQFWGQQVLDHVQETELVHLLRALESQQATA